jgi:CcmD family protein
MIRGVSTLRSATRVRSTPGWMRIPALVMALGANLALALPAAAQEFVKVQDGTREQLPATPFVGVAYGFIWVAILAYLFVMARRLGRVQGELQELRRRFERSGAADTSPRR